MTVTLSEIQRALDDLIAGARLREEIAGWADSARRADDQEQLSFDPPNARDRIWRAITYLMGVDMKTSPTSYLHSTADFEAFRKTLGL
jgi:hypothetical protein